MRKLVVLWVLLLVSGLVACGGEAGPAGGVAGEGDAAAGQQLYSQSILGTQQGCMACHSLESGVAIVGPSLARIGTDAGSRVSGQSAEEYLRQSILEPDAFVVAGFGGGIMPKVYANELSEQQVKDLVAFLLTLK